MIKSFKIRLYPTKEQEQKMWQHIGACRFVWNYMLDLQQKRYENEEKHLSRFDMIKALTPLKNEGEHKWLYDISNTTLQVACTDLSKAYDRFFKKISGFPKFKSRKRSKPSFPIRETIWFDGDTAHVQKIGNVKYKTDFVLPLGTGNKFTNPRISYTNSKWILTFGMECENQAHDLNDFTMGIDLGIKETATAAYGEERLVFHNINKSKRVRGLQKKLQHTQRSISRKYEANKDSNKFVKTKNIEREENKLRSIYSRITNIRTNYIHQSTHKIVSLLPRAIVMEDLNVQGMMKNKHLSKAIAEQCFYEWIRQMKYKCEWNGIEFIQVDRFYPSSKTCSNCGCIKQDLKLKDRIFVCPECGFEEDRDYNAAVNLMRYAA